jgi:hypothetical protein
MVRRLSLMIIAVLALCGAAQAQDSAAKCKIGRPAYCDKHAGTNCATTNSSKKPSACEAWRAGCFDCHAAADACLGNRIQLRSVPVCGRCQAAWSACMARNQRHHWPRQS